MGHDLYLSRVGVDDFMFCFSKTFKKREDQLFYKKYTKKPYTGMLERTLWHGGWIRGYMQNGLHEGLWQSYDSDGRLALSGYFLEGKPIGQWKRFNHGSLGLIKANFKEGKLHGTYEEYFSSKPRHKIEKSPFQSDFFDHDFSSNEVWEHYSESKDRRYNLATKGQFIDGKQEGVWEFYKLNYRMTKHATKKCSDLSSKSSYKRGERIDKHKI